MASELPDDWRSVRTEEVADARAHAMATGPFGSAISSKFFVPKGVPVIRGSNLSETVGTRLSHKKLVFIPEELAAKFHRSEVRAGDLVFTCWGTIGQVGLIDGRAEYPSYIVSNKQMKLTPAPSKADSLFLYYVFSSPDVMGDIQGQKIGSSVPGFNLGQLKAVQIPLPPLPEQRRIAAVLGALDDKIELNGQMNRTLEAMAQALFKSWFIDFDGHDDLVPSELGPIPRGWEVGKFVDVAKQHRLTVKPEEQEPDTPYIGLADMPQRAIALAEWGHASDATSAKAQFVENDFLFGKLRPYFKKVGVAPCDGVCSSDIIVVRPKENQWYGYTLGVLTLDAFIDFTTAVSTGTRMPRVSWKAMAGYDLAIPPKERAEEFDAFVRPTVERIKANTWESRTLAALRDTLLPKLISGEIRVPEAEDGLEEAEL